MLRCLARYMPNLRSESHLVLAVLDYYSWYCSVTGLRAPACSLSEVVFDLNTRLRAQPFRLRPPAASSPNSGARGPKGEFPAPEKVTERGRVLGERGVNTPYK